MYFECHYFDVSLNRGLDSRFGRPATKTSAVKPKKSTGMVVDPGQLGYGWDSDSVAGCLLRKKCRDSMLIAGVMR